MLDSFDCIPSFLSLSYKNYMKNKHNVVICIFYKYQNCFHQ